ncbi:hypothetical protein HZC30_05205 [Candidatus Woesearchaeota archaeon]|nr:hypothetical protein [Candidatus Woesearchaeota archaeon]
MIPEVLLNIARYRVSTSDDLSVICRNAQTIRRIGENTPYLYERAQNAFDAALGKYNTLLNQRLDNYLKIILTEKGDTNRHIIIVDPSTIDTNLSGL